MIYLEVSAVGAVNNLWVVGLLMGFFPFGVYLAYIHFKTTLPAQIVESACLDGLTDIQTFFKIALPISRQAVALVPYAGAAAPVEQHDRLGRLQQLVSSSPLFDPTNAAGLDVRLYAPHLALATLVTTLPVLIVFVLAQRYLVRGQTLGAVKG